MEGPTMVLIVFIALYYTYTMAKHQYLRNTMIVYHCLMAKHCRTAASILKILGPNLRQENCQQVDAQSVMEGPTMVLIVFIALYYTYAMAKHQHLRNTMIVYHCLMAKHCRTDASILKIRTQSEARELPTSGCAKCDGGPYNGADSVHCPLLYICNGKTSISSVNTMIVYHHLMAKHCRTAGSISKILGPNLRQENCQQVDMRKCDGGP